MAEVKEEAQKAKPQKQLQKKQANPERPKHEYEDYLIFLHKKKVELHVDYSGTILKLQGILRAKARFDVQLILNEEKKEIVTVNKAYIVMVKPV